MKVLMKIMNIKSVIATILVVAAGSGLAFDRLSSDNVGDVRIVPVKLTVDTTPVDRNQSFRSSYSSIVKNVIPSVVNVYTSREMEVVPFLSPFGDNPFFRRFFDPYGDQQRDLRNRPAPKQQGLGSGVIVTGDGYILTNNHVVEEAVEVKVALSDGREFEAEVVGTDPKTDVAVLKIDADGLPFLTAADSSMVEVGDVVLAIGNPFGIGQTVTMGIVSATGRSHMGLSAPVRAGAR
jgi:S1-C subfamily serine protease